MKFLIFEWMTGGGLLVERIEIDPNCPFQSQGRAMLEAVTADLAAHAKSIGAEWTSVVPCDRRIDLQVPGNCELVNTTTPDLNEVLTSLAAKVDHILLIAPECQIRFPDGRIVPCLEECVRWMEPWKDKLISPDLEFVKIASDKTETCNRLKKAGVACPVGIRMDQLSDVSWPEIGNPIVLKPNFGAGGDGLELVAADEPVACQGDAALWRAEKFHAGRAASCGVICGLDNNRVLDPVYQKFDGEPFGAFVSAERITDKAEKQRAQQLATAAINAMPPTRGYVGIDVVLGETEKEDVVVEVNPRLTTSYITIRETAQLFSDIET